MNQKLPKEFIQLVQDALNHEFTIGLLENQSLSFGIKKREFDLADISSLFFVELKFQNKSFDRGNIIQQINSLISSLSSISPSRNIQLAIIFINTLSKNDRDFYEKNLRSLRNDKVKLFDIQDIISIALKNEIKFDQDVIKNMFNLNEAAEAVNANNSLETNEFEIQGVKNVYFGQQIGIELRNYDVFILPKSTLGGVGKNGISHAVLEILGIDPFGFTFQEKPLYAKGYKWFIRELNNKVIYIGFVYTRDENKKGIDFIDNLKRAINNFKQFVNFNEIKKNKVNVFIPLLGAGQAGLDPLLSLQNIIQGVQILRRILPFHKIRINLPPKATESELNKYKHHMSVAISGPPPPGLIEDEIHNEIEIENEQRKTDKIPFHLDQVVDEDKLGREPVAKEFVRLIKKDIFTEKLNHSFMVHLQGKWGAGKSSFLNFIKHNLKSDGENWIVIDYNAWQNQHIKPPWWSFIDQVYLQSRHQIYLTGIRSSLYFRFKEGFRRIWRYSGWDKIVAFIITLISIICIVYFGEDIINLFSNTSDKENENNSISFFGNFGKLILTLSSLLGALYGFTKFITIPFFINSSKEAKSFVLRASDPMNQVKKHFNDLVDNINSKKKRRQLAVFIDDIDRCDKEYIVQLLEGIQTLFKDKRVLYIIAGDKNWISTSFGNTYKDFVEDVAEKKQLGEFFIEKAFQLSFRLPNISEESKQNYWDHVLGMNKIETSKKVNSIEELSENKREELKNELLNSKSELTNPTFVQDIQEKYNLSGDTASNIVIEEKNKNTEELKHLLQDYHHYFDTNPRSIIRLANNYTMARTILMAERVSFNEHKLFRWLVIEDLCPEVKGVILSASKITELEEFINEAKDLVKRINSLKLFKGEEEFMQGQITIEDIKTIKGL